VVCLVKFEVCILRMVYRWCSYFEGVLANPMDRVEASTIPLTTVFDFLRDPGTSFAPLCQLSACAVVRVRVRWCACVRNRW